MEEEEEKVLRMLIKQLSIVHRYIDKINIIGEKNGLMYEAEGGDMEQEPPPRLQIINNLVSNRGRQITTL